MIDSFVILTPLLVVPIALLFFFVGCSFDTSGLAGGPKLEATFRIEFYYAGDPKDRVFRFYILDPGAVSDVVLWWSQTGDIQEDDEQQGNHATSVWHEFSERPESGSKTLACEVTELIEDTDGDTLEVKLVSKGDDVCKPSFLPERHYFIKFTAGVSADGTMPHSEFDTCSWVII